MDGSAASGVDGADKSQTGESLNVSVAARTTFVAILAWVLWFESAMQGSAALDIPDRKEAWLLDTFETKRECEEAMKPKVAKQRSKGDAEVPKIRDVPGGAVFGKGGRESTFRYLCLPSGTPPPGAKLRSIP